MRTVNIKNKKIGEGIPKICISLMGKTTEDILAQAKKILDESIKNDVDIVEVRGDYFEKLNDMDALKDVLCKLADMFGDIIVLFTIRSQSEGGEKLAFSSPSIYEINKYVIENRLADMVDVELFSGDVQARELITLAHAKNVKIIMSNHDFKTTPDQTVIIDRLKEMQEIGADIAKIAVMPNNKQHLLELLQATNVMSNTYADIPIVTISMGELGALSRVCGQVFGSSITFAALEKASAPGQIPVDEMRALLNKVNKYM